MYINQHILLTHNFRPSGQKKSEEIKDNIGNGTILNSFVSPRIGNRYVKRPEPITVACTSSSASPSCGSSLTASQTTSFYITDKDCSSISSSTFDHNSDKISLASKRKQDALFNEMLHKAPKHPQRYFNGYYILLGHVSLLISSS